MFLVPLLVGQLLLFGGLLFLLRYILIRHATQATGHLQALSQEALAQQEALKKRLEESERQYQEQISKAQDEARQIKAQVLQEATAAQQQMIEQARREAERIVSQAIQARDALHSELTQSFDARAMERACELLQKTLPRVLQEATHAQWLDELIKNGLLPVERIETREEIHEAKVVSAFPLTSTQKKHLLDRLQTALGAPLTLQEVVDPGIVAGLVITLGHLVLDGSLASKLWEAARDAQNAAR